MRANQEFEKQPDTAWTASVPTTQAGRMHAAIEKAVIVAPGFLRGDVDAEHMATTMVDAVRIYLEQEHAAGSDGFPHEADARALQGTLHELMTCGSGYLASRCDSACVARTMTEIVREFGSTAEP